SEVIKKPSLGGRLNVKFAISGAGQVIGSYIASSTINDSTVESCISQALSRWEFPKPQDGRVVFVACPFVVPLAGGPAPAPGSATLPLVPDAWQLALTALRDQSTRTDATTRLDKVARLLGVPVRRPPAVMAWWLVDRRLRS